MAWAIEYFKEAQKDLAKIDHSQKLQVLKAIEKYVCFSEKKLKLEKYY